MCTQCDPKSGPTDNAFADLPEKYRDTALEILESDYLQGFPHYAPERLAMVTEALAWSNLALLAQLQQ